MAPTSKTDPSLSRAQSHVGHSRGGGGQGWGAAPHSVQGPGHPLGPPGPAHPFPGSDLLSPSSSLLSRGPVPQEAEATENQAGLRAEAAGSCAAGHSSLCGAQPGPRPPLPNTRPMGRPPRCGLWGSRPASGPRQVWSLLVGGQQAVWGSVWRPSHSPGEGWAGQNAPTAPALRAGHPPIGWGVAQARRSAGWALPTPHTHSEACRGRAGKDPKGQACEEGKVLDSRLSTEVRSGESCPHPPCLCGFSQSPFPASAQPGRCRPLRMAGGRWEGALGGSSAHRTAVQASW